MIIVLLTSLSTFLDSKLQTPDRTITTHLLLNMLDVYLIPMIMVKKAVDIFTIFAYAFLLSSISQVWVEERESLLI